MIKKIKKVNIVYFLVAIISTDNQLPFFIFKTINTIQKKYSISSDTGNRVRFHWEATLCMLHFRSAFEQTILSYPRFRYLFSMTRT